MEDVWCSYQLGAIASAVEELELLAKSSLDQPIEFFYPVHVIETTKFTDFMMP